MTTNSANSGVDTSASVAREGVVPIKPRQPPSAHPTASSTTFPGFPPDHDSPGPAPVTVAPPPPQAPARADQAFVGTLAAIAAVLASRIVLLLTVAGAFVLALRADSDHGLYVLIAYAMLAVLPTVGLDIITHRRGGQ